MKAPWILALVGPLLGALGLCAGCTSPARGFCEAAGACDEEGTPYDPVGESDDSVDVCTADAEGALAVLRANDDDACQEAALALEAWYACVQQKLAEGEECAGLRAGDDNECQGERDELDEKLADGGRDCTEDEE